MEIPDQHPPRNLGLDLVRATEAAALTAGRFMGLGKLDEADLTAAEAMRGVLDSLDMQGYIVIGEEGKLGSACSLSSGLMVGSGNGPQMDVLLDPIDGRRLLASGQPGAIAVAAVAPRGSLWTCSPALYMEKIVVDYEVGEALVPECLDAPAPWTLSLVARRKGKEVKDLIVFVLDRPRHQHLVEEIRSVGARVMLVRDGDIAGALLAASISGKADLLMGTGGVQEGIIAVCGVKALGGAMLGRLSPQSEAERDRVQTAGLSTDQILTCDDIVTSNEIFFAATGVTDGSLLEGVHYRGNWAETHSLILRSETRSRRYVRAEHYIVPGHTMAAPG
jgi:fructose-1,6-bisphosphatase II